MAKTVPGPIFDTAEDFSLAADKYFAECDENGELYSPAGLLLGLKKHGAKHRFVSKERLEKWRTGDEGTEIEGLRDAVLEAFARIEHQIETDAVYMEKAMNTRAIFLLKQKALGGMQDVQKEDKAKVEIVVKHDNGVDTSDFQ